MTDPTHVQIQGNAILLPTRAQPGLTEGSLMLTTDDGLVGLRVPTAFAPFIAPGDTIMVTLSVVKYGMEGAPAPLVQKKSGLIIPPSNQQN